MGSMWVLLIVLITLSVTKSQECDFDDLGLQPDGNCYVNIKCSASILSINKFINNWNCIYTNNYEYDYYGQRRRVKNDNYFINLRIELEQEGMFLAVEEQYNHIRNLDYSNLTLSSIPKEFDKLSKLTHLDLSNNYIQTVNINELLKLKSLQSLNISFNEIVTIAYTMQDQSSERSEVTTLDFSHNQIESLPDNCFISFPSLAYLNISHNFIKSFSVLTFEGISRLKILDVSNNKIQEIDHTLVRFTQLSKLFMNKNKLLSIEDSNFKTMTNLQFLNLSCNVIEKIDPNSFETMTNLQTLDLSSNKVKRVEKNMFMKNIFLGTLYFHKNEIEIIEDGFLNGTNVTSFNIENNHLTGTINKYTFNGLFKTLNLSRSNISALGAYAFSSLPLLETLNLSDNIINTVNKEAFHGLVNLKSLDASHNNISEINFEKSDLHNLLYLNLSHNKIAKIYLSTFEHLTELIYLDISFNMVTNIENGCFKYCPKLISLQMEANMFKSQLNDTTFSSLSSLKAINLSSSEITAIRNGTFSSLTALESIDLSKNSICLIEYSSFKDLQSISLIKLSNNLLSSFHINTKEVISIQVLYLNNNKLTEITNDTFAYLINLKELYLAHNNIVNLASLSNLKSLSMLDLSYITNDNKTGAILNSVDNLTLNILNIRATKINFTFVNSINLTVYNLDLSVNKIRQLKTLHINQIKKLANLNLFDNEIEIIDKHSFPDMLSLIDLDLSFNAINSIQPGSFIGTPQLKSLNLSHNVIKTLKYGVFDGLKNLHFLNISHNALISFNIELFHKNPMIQELSLDHNQLTSLDLYGMHSKNIQRVLIGGNQIACKVLIGAKESHLENFEISAETLDYHSENVDGISCFSENNKLEAFNQNRDYSSNTTIIEILNEINKNILVLTEKKSEPNDISKNISDAYAKSVLSVLRESQVNYTKIMNMTMDLDSNRINETQKTLTFLIGKLNNQSAQLQNSLQKGYTNQNYEYTQKWNKENYKDWKISGEMLEVLLYLLTICVLIITITILWVMYKLSFKNIKSYNVRNTSSNSIAENMEME